MDILVEELQSYIRPDILTNASIVGPDGLRTFLLRTLRRLSKAHDAYELGKVGLTFFAIMSSYLYTISGMFFIKKLITVEPVGMW